jgi:hypothetical protein
LSIERYNCSWVEWQPLDGAGRNRTIPKEPGLYRIRRLGRNDLDYIGQTGMGLRQRLGMLAGVYKDMMPYRDPHTVGPALWAMRDMAGCEYEASTCSLPDLSTPQRKGLECVEIALYRQKQRRSPTFNFGRMTDGYQMSSHNNTRLAASGRRYRGKMMGRNDDSHLLGTVPFGELNGPSTGSNWVGLDWTEWLSVNDVTAFLNSGDTGIYRLRISGVSKLSYVGEGKVRSRIKAHIRNGSKPEHRQYHSFKDIGSLEFSCVILPNLKKHHFLELETDLIGAHVLEHETAPLAQFLG